MGERGIKQDRLDGQGKRRDGVLEQSGGFITETGKSEASDESRTGRKKFLIGYRKKMGGEGI